MTQNCLIPREKAKKKFCMKIFEKLQVSDEKYKEIFFKKKSWSQMIQNCLIRREMAKKISAADIFSCSQPLNGWFKKIEKCL